MAGCCGKGKRADSNAPAAAGSNSIASVGGAPPSDLPGVQEGRVLVQYTGGKGKGSHYYRGKGTNHPYKVKWGQFLYVDPKDARSKDQQPRLSNFVLAVEEEKPVVRGSRSRNINRKPVV